MWDEQERFAKGFLKAFAWLLAVFGVALAALSLAAGVPDFFVVFLLLPAPWQLSRWPMGS